MPEKKKICVITPVHWSYRMGGIEYQVKLLIEKMVKNKNIDILYLSQKIKNGYCPQSYDLLKISRENVFQQYGLFIDAVNLLRLLKKNRPDVIYQNGGCAYTGIAAFYAKRAKCRMIWHIASDNDLSSNDERGISKPNKALDRKLLHWGIKHSDIIIAQSESQRNIVSKINPKAVIHVIRNFHPLPCEASSTQKSKKIIWVANIKKLKQPEMYIKLAEEMLKQHLDVECLMVGAPAHYPAGYQNQIEETIKGVPNVKYLGMLPVEQVNDLIGKSKLLINTSKWEGFPNTFIQAWMRNTPVISLNCDPDNILQDYHCGIKSSTFEKMIEDTVSLLKNDGMITQMGHNAKKYAFEHHSVNNLDRLEKIIMESRS